MIVTVSYFEGLKIFEFNRQSNANAQFFKSIALLASGLLTFLLYCFAGKWSISRFTVSVCSGSATMNSFVHNC